MDSIVVLTTHERADWFRAALGTDADFRLDYKKTGSLQDLLLNAKLAGGSVVVLDEEHFPSADEMLFGIESYVNDAHRKTKAMRIVVVCSKRHPGDRVLSRLAGYCHIYDLLYGVDGVDIIAPLQELVENPRSRIDVVSLLNEPVAEPTESASGMLGHSRKGENVSEEEAELDPLGVVDLSRIIRPGQRLLLEVIVR